jgi:NADH-quinone oxidoreductase subunit J
VQVVVYVGGIVVLIIFSIFLTQQSGLSMARPSWKRVVAAIAAVACGIIVTILQLDAFNMKPGSTAFDWSMQSIGTKMLSTGADGYALPFEVVSVLLLAAMIGCIVIAMKSPAKTTLPDE